MWKISTTATSEGERPPRCHASTIPVITMGKEWLVPEWALRYMREGKVVQMDTDNEGHNGAPHKTRAKRNARKK